MIYSVLYKFIRAVLIIIPILVLGWLGVNKLVPSGRMEAVYDMKKETPFISKLYPKDRVLEIKKIVNGDFYRSILVEPVYFDLKPNNQFEKVAITLKYKISGQTTLKMGGLINKKDWLFDFRELGARENKWQSQTEIFDFSRLVSEGSNFRFGFSAPEMKSGQIEISEIKVVFERNQLTPKEVINKIFDAVAWRLNKLF